MKPYYFNAVQPTRVNRFKQTFDQNISVLACIPTAKFEIDTRKRLLIETTNLCVNRFVFIYRNRGLGTTLETLPLNIQVQG